MKKLSFVVAMLAGMFILTAGCCHCGQNCPKPKPQEPCPMAQKPCPMPPPGGPMMPGPCPMMQQPMMMPCCMVMVPCPQMMPPCPMGPGRPGCPMMQGPCPKKPHCPMMKGECPPKPDCPEAKAGKPVPPRKHPGMEQFKKRMDAMKQLREKYPQEMLEIDIAIIAQEDKVDALAAKAGIELPKRPADFRRLRVAFPKEMQELEAKAPEMKPGEFRAEIKKLQEKLEKK